MSEDIKNEDVVPATPTENEPIIAPETAAKAEEIVAEILSETKIEEAPKPDESVITGSKGTPKEEVQALGSVADGVIGADRKPVAPKPAKPAAAPKADKDVVALYSSRNMHWEGVGKLSKGYNIVSKEASEKWLTKEHVRIADAKEVAKGYGL
jgi:hypothetical protein